jgi:hypothetical protein
VRKDGGDEGKGRWFYRRGEDGMVEMANCFFCSILELNEESDDEKRGWGSEECISPFIVFRQAPRKIIDRFLLPPG